MTTRRTTQPGPAGPDEAQDAPDTQPAADPPQDDPQDHPAAGEDGRVAGGRLADLPAAPAIPDGVTYAVAREPLFIVNPEAGVAPVRAFNAGDRVPAELVEKFGWHDLTDLPEWATAPPAPASDKDEEH